MGRENHTIVFGWTGKNLAKQLAGRKHKWLAGF
jgi:hypothetical protein